MEEYKKLGIECIEEFKADNEFHLNKLHKVLTSRVVEYILVLKTIYFQSFDELLVLLQKEPKKVSKREQALFLNHLIRQEQFSQGERGRSIRNSLDFNIKSSISNMNNIKQNVRNLVDNTNPHDGIAPRESLPTHIGRHGDS